MINFVCFSLLAQGVSINSISEPRPSFVDTSSGKWKQIECESSKDVVGVDLDENRRNDCGHDQKSSGGSNNKGVAISSADTIISAGHGPSNKPAAAESQNKNNGVRSSPVTGSGHCSDSGNGGSPLTASATNNLSSSSSSSASSASSSPIAIMCDRKRKERHESCSQGQEKKVIR